jgi:hypothetical protein
MLWAMFFTSVANADTVGGNSSDGCQSSSLIAYEGDIVGMAELRIRFRLNIPDAGTVVTGRWLLSNGQAAPSKAWQGPISVWASSETAGGFYSPLIIRFIPGSVGRARFVIERPADYGSCFIVSNVQVDRVRTGNGGGGAVPTPPPGGGGVATPSPSPTPEGGPPSASPTATPTSPPCSNTNPIPAGCVPPPGYCWGYGPPTPGQGWPIMECESATPSPSPTPSPTPSPPPRVECTTHDVDPRWTSDNRTCKSPDGEHFDFLSGHSYTVTFFAPTTGGGNQAGGHFRQGGHSSADTAMSACMGSPASNMGAATSRSCTFTVTTVAAGFYRYGFWMISWAASATTGYMSIVDNNPAATPTPTPVPSSTPTPSPTLPPNWGTAPPPPPGEGGGAGQPGSGDGFEDIDGNDVDAGTGGGDDGVPGSSGGGSGVPECTVSDLTLKPGYQPYDPVTDISDLGPRIDGKDPVSGIATAVGWLGDMLWTMPNRIGNGIKWAVNMTVNFIIPGDCLPDIIEARMTAINAEPPFSLFTDVNTLLTTTSAGSAALGDIPLPGGETIALPVDMIEGAAGVRPVLVGAVWLMAALAILSLIAGTFGVKGTGE